MSLVSVLHDLVCAEARISPTNGNELHLLETDASASLRKVVLALANNERSACVALDFQVAAGTKRRSSCLSEVLNPDSPHPLRAACDALLCIERGDTCHVIHIELKSGDAEKRAIDQLSNSRCFSRFLRDLAVQWYGIKPQAYQEWFVLLTSGKKTNARKRKTSVSPEAYAPMEKPSKDPKKPTIFSLQNEGRIHIGKFFQS
jgi:hypothetical protein